LVLLIVPPNGTFKVPPPSAMTPLLVWPEESAAPLLTVVMMGS
jgi:hypothetical protein